MTKSEREYVDTLTWIIAQQLRIIAALKGSLRSVHSLACAATRSSGATARADALEEIKIVAGKVLNPDRYAGLPTSGTLDEIAGKQLER